MSRLKNVVKLSEDMRDKMNTRYVLTCGNMFDLIGHYENIFELVNAAFRLGYCQGAKAERKRAKEGAE